MSRTQPTGGQQWVLSFQCPECNEPAGTWCRASRGRRDFTVILHKDRWVYAGAAETTRTTRAMNNLDGLMMI